MSNLFQRFFWSCAGVDVEVLEQCTSDQKKYTSIGAVIFMVACFASLAMYFAASTIIKSNVAAIGVSLIWGTLILMLDRLIVSTIRNDEDTTNRDRWIAAIPRIFLAAIIAIVISRPIEVQIFSEEIEKQILTDRVIEQNNFKQNLEKGSSLNSLMNTDTSLSQKKEMTQALLMEEDIPTEEYQRLKSEIVLAKNELSQTEKEKEHKDYVFSQSQLEKLDNASRNDDKYYESYNRQNWLDETKTTYTLIPERRLRAEWNEEEAKWKRIISTTNNKIYKARKKLEQLEKEKKEEKERYYKSVSLKIAEIEEERDSIQKEHQKELGQIDQGVKEFQKENNDSIPSFFTKMKALSNLGHEMNASGNRTGKNLFWWAKLFILLLFFVVEISPVFVKLISPSGAYEDAFLKKQDTDRQIFSDNLNVKIEVAQHLQEQWKREQIRSSESENQNSGITTKNKEVIE